MPEIVVKGTVADHKVTVDVPSDWPEGAEVEAVVRPLEPDTERDAHNRKLIAYLESLRDQPGRKEPTKEEIDRYIQEERDSWE